MMVTCVIAACIVCGFSVGYLVDLMMWLIAVPVFVRRWLRVRWFRRRLRAARMLRNKMNEQFARGVCYRGYRLVHVSNRMRWYAVDFDGVRFQVVAERCTISGIMTWCDEHQNESSSLQVM